MDLPLREFALDPYYVRLRVTGVPAMFQQLELDINLPPNIEFTQSQVEEFQRSLFTMLRLSRSVSRREYRRLQQQLQLPVNYCPRGFSQRYELHRVWKYDLIPANILVRLQANCNVLVRLEELLEESIRLEAFLELQSTRRLTELPDSVAKLFGHESRVDEYVAVYDHCVAKATGRYQALFPKGVLFP